MIWRYLGNMTWQLAYRGFKIRVKGTCRGDMWMVIKGKRLVKHGWAKHLLDCMDLGMRAADGIQKNDRELRDKVKKLKNRMDFERPMGCAVELSTPPCNDGFY